MTYRAKNGRLWRLHGPVSDERGTRAILECVDATNPKAGYALNVNLWPDEAVGLRRLLESLAERDSVAPSESE